MSAIKKKHTHIKRIYVRAEYPYIDESYRDYLLQSYEDTYYPMHIINVGKAVYIKRNLEMIDKSDICVIYYTSDYSTPQRKQGRKSLFDYSLQSGTKLAYTYATRINKKIINLADGK